MIVLSEVVDSSPSPTRNPGIDLALQTATALEVPRYLLGSPRQSQKAWCETVLAAVPDYESEMLGLWIGETPTVTHYEAVYNQALQKRIRLLNTPQEHRTLYDAEQMCANLQEFMPASAAISDVAQCEVALAHLGLPILVRGEAPFNPLSPRANTLEELQHLVASLLQPTRSPDQENGFASANSSAILQQAILQQVVPLRSHPTPIGMKLGRIFRVFLYRQTLITYGYSWAGDHAERYLSTPEEEALLNLVFQAIARINAPFVSLDVGQLETEDWLILGTGDPQFTTTEQIPWIQFWQAMREIG